VHRQERHGAKQEGERAETTARPTARRRAGGLTSLVSTLLLRRAVITDAEQLRRVDAPDV
jgi:hypothetical protein